MSYEIILSIREDSPQGRNIEMLAEAEHVSREEAALKLLAAPTPLSPLARALAMVEQRDARTGPAMRRVLGINDAATEIRQMREERTP